MAPRRGGRAAGSNRIAWNSLSNVELHHLLRIGGTNIAAGSTRAQLLTAAKRHDNRPSAAELANFIAANPPPAAPLPPPAAPPLPPPINDDDIQPAEEDGVAPRSNKRPRHEPPQQPASPVAVEEDAQIQRIINHCISAMDDRMEGRLAQLEQKLENQLTTITDIITSSNPNKRHSAPSAAALPLSPPIAHLLDESLELSPPSSKGTGDVLRHILQADRKLNSEIKRVQAIPELTHIDKATIKDSLAGKFIELNSIKPPNILVNPWLITFIIIIIIIIVIVIVNVIFFTGHMDGMDNEFRCTQTVTPRNFWRY
jgi:hypothetical protein